MNQLPTPIVEVEATRPGAVWRLTYIEPCPNCGSRHFHGGGNGPEPTLSQGLTASRTTHCSSVHKVFRDDCQAERQPGGYKRCAVEHFSGMVDLKLVRVIHQ